MGYGQLFLKIKFEKGGVLEGESEYTGFEKQIMIEGADWSIDTKDTQDGAGRARKNIRRVELSSLKLNKRFDLSSVAMLKCFDGRDRIVKGRLTMAHSEVGVFDNGALREAFVLEFEKGYIEQYDLDMEASEGQAILRENIHMVFTNLKVEITPVNASGKYERSKMVFQTELEDNLTLGR
jgi:type VI protein secretion system component Hcp